jgi:hypothetical protein
MEVIIKEGNTETTYLINKKYEKTIFKVLEVFSEGSIA